MRKRVGSRGRRWMSLGICERLSIPSWFPQGLKPASFGIASGPADAVPFPTQNSLRSTGETVAFRKSVHAARLKQRLP